MTDEEKAKLAQEIQQGNLGYVQKAIAEHSNCLTTVLWNANNEQYSAIHIAAMEGQLAILKLLLDTNLDLLEAQDGDGQTPLLWAAAQGYEDIVRELANRGANLTVATFNKDPYCNGYTAVHWAVENGHAKVLCCLLELGATGDMVKGSEQYHLIHMAAIKGHAELVKVLVDYNPEFLNLRDTHGRTPVFLAAYYGHAALVKEFIAENADLDLACTSPGHPHQDMRPLDIATTLEDYVIINLLLLNMSAYQNENKIKVLPFIRSAAQALAFMAVDPSVTKIFLQNQVIVDLITQWDGCSVSEKLIFKYTKRSQQQASSVVLIDRDNYTTDFYQPSKEIGRGAYGLVRLYESFSGESFPGGKKIAVKSSINPEKVHKEQDLARLREKFAKEVAFTRRAYPDDSISETFEHHRNEGSHHKYNNRFLMPYIEGKIISELIPSITSSMQLAEITLQIAKELHRIHRLGIIHSDFHAANIMARDENGQFIIRVLDFGCASDVTEEHARCVKPTAIGKWYPPEVCCEMKEQCVAPDSSQDVYALGFLLRSLFDKQKSPYQELKQQFRSIRMFMLQALDTAPKGRPTLEKFCAQLSDELNSKRAKLKSSDKESNTSSAPKLSELSTFWAQQPKQEQVIAAPLQVQEERDLEVDQDQIKDQDQNACTQTIDGCVSACVIS